jgi:hypothetical protein
MTRKIWTEEYFEEMDWHDCPIYAISFAPAFSLQFDIDYLFRWIDKKSHYKFEIAPCTLIFENAYDLKIDLETYDGLEIDGIEKSNPQRPKNAEFIKREIEYDWEINLQQGTIAFKSVGLKLFVRQEPIISRVQKLGEDVRGPISFEQIIY